MKRIITLVLAIALIPMTYSCGESKAEKAARIEQEQRKREEQQRKEREANSLTTSKGTHSIESIYKWAYNQGVDDGAFQKRTNSTTYGRWTFTDDADFNHWFGVEKKFKNVWVENLGIPKSEKEKEIYDKAEKIYINAFKEGWDFTSK